MLAQIIDTETLLQITQYPRMVIDNYHQYPEHSTSDQDIPTLDKMDTYHQ